MTQGPRNVKSFQRRSAARLSFLLAAALLVTRSICAAETVTGTVYDAQGNPVAGARVGSSFTFASVAGQVKVQISYADPPILSDARGMFSIPAAPVRYTHVLVAAGSNGTLGFAVRDDSTPARIVLRTPARLKLQIVKRFGHPQPFSIELLAAGSAVGYATVSGGSADLAVPQGALELNGGDAESMTVKEMLALAADKPTSERLELQPTLWARNLGKTAPRFTATDVHNWSGGKQFTSPPGKWVLVTFWATWCLPCVREMPKMIDFYEKNARLRRQFDIIAVHSPDGTSFSGIQSQYDHLVTVWGKPIPFPLVFDSTGETHQRWGIETYPTNILVDPAGRIVGAAALQDLAASLGIQNGSGE